jgi:hypothetical protein
MAASHAASMAGTIESMALAGDLEAAGIMLSLLEKEMTHVISSLEALCMETVE